MKALLRVLLIIFGLVFVANSIYLYQITAFNIALVIELVYGMIHILIAIFWNVIAKYTRKGLMKYVKYTAILANAIIILTMGFLFIYSKIDTATYKEDAVIVLGAGIRGKVITAPLYFRLEKCIDYIKKNPNAIIVVSGGQGEGETIAESEAMKTYLVKRGIKANKIVEENKSTSTSENFEFSKKVLDDYFKKNYSVAFISNNFHMFRANQLAKFSGLKCSYVHADMPSYLIPELYLREVFAVGQMLILRK